MARPCIIVSMFFKGKENTNCLLVLWKQHRIKWHKNVKNSLLELLSIPSVKIKKTLLCHLCPQYLSLPAPCSLFSIPMIVTSTGKPMTILLTVLALTFNLVTPSSQDITLESSRMWTILSFSNVSQGHDFWQVQILLSWNSSVFCFITYSQP